MILHLCPEILIMQDIYHCIQKLKLRKYGLSYPHFQVMLLMIELCNKGLFSALFVDVRASVQVQLLSHF